MIELPERSKKLLKAAGFEFRLTREEGFNSLVLRVESTGVWGSVIDREEFLDVYDITVMACFARYHRKKAAKIQRLYERVKKQRAAEKVSGE